MDSYQDIPVTKIDIAGQMVRDARDDDYITELVNNISIQGLHNPITVRAKDGDGYQLLAGFHRLEAFKRLGRPTIPAHIENRTDIPVTVIALTENIIRRDLSLEEECRAVEQLNSVQKLSPSQICDLIGKSRAWVDRRLMAPNLPEKVRTSLFEGLISLIQAELIGPIPDEGIRNTILNQTIYGKLTASQTQDLVELYKASPTIQTAVQDGVETAQKVQVTAQNVRRCDACGVSTTLEHLMPIWVCRAGCRTAEPNPTPDPGKTK